MYRSAIGAIATIRARPIRTTSSRCTADFGPGRGTRGARRWRRSAEADRASPSASAAHRGDRTSDAFRRRAFLARWPSDVLDEERLETRLGDLEPTDRRAVREHRRQDRVGLGPGKELELGAVGVVADGFDARQSADPFGPERRTRRRVGPFCVRSSASGRGHGRRPRAGRGRRSRRIRRAPRPPPSGASRRSSVRPRSRSSMNASRSRIRLTGSSPVNGSSIRSTSGSWRTAAMNWTFCWLPLDSSSARLSAYSGMRKRRSQPIAARRARSGGSPYSEAK